MQLKGPRCEVLCLEMPRIHGRVNSPYFLSAVTIRLCRITPMVGCSPSLWEPLIYTPNRYGLPLIYGLTDLYSWHHSKESEETMWAAFGEGRFCLPYLLPRSDISSLPLTFCPPPAPPKKFLPHKMLHGIGTLLMLPHLCHCIVSAVAKARIGT